MKRAEDIIEAALAGIPGIDTIDADVLIDRITDALWEAGLLLTDEVTTVEVRKASVPVELVEAYGLRIRLDANGDAAEIVAPGGLEILA